MTPPTEQGANRSLTTPQDTDRNSQPSVPPASPPSSADRDIPLRTDDADLFLPEALEHHYGTQRAKELLRITPRWMSWTSRLLLAVLATTVALLAFTQVPEVIHGVAVYRHQTTLWLRSPTTATVERWSVVPGSRVEAGDPLLLLRPTTMADTATDSTGPMPQQLEAPTAGVVTTLSSRPGDLVMPRQPLVGLAPAASGGEILALFDATTHRHLQAGQTVTWWAGDRPESRQLVITEVAERAVQRQEGLRFLGLPETSAAAPSGLGVSRLGATVVVVRAKAKAPNGAPWVDGIDGAVSFELGSQRLFFLLMPFAKGDGGRGHG